MKQEKKHEPSKVRAKDGAAAPRRVTLKALAKHLGLSPTTISLVLNESPAADAIPQRTKDRVLAAARELDYRPDFVARSLRSQRSYSIGVLVSEISGGYSAGVMSGIECSLLNAGYFGLMASHQFNPEYLKRYLSLLRDRGVEGYILVNTPIEQAPELPTVAVSGLRMLEGASNVVIDHDRAAELALGHLTELGHHRIAFFRGPSVIPDSEDRWRAITEVAASKGIPIRDDLTFRLGVEPTDAALSLQEFYHEGYTFGSQLAAGSSKFTALFAFNDPSAIGAMRALLEAGIRVPQDVSVVGFDDIDSAAFHNPGLTTIRQPLRRMGSEAAQILLHHLAGEGDFPKQVSIRPELVVRDSTAPAPS